jgi:uncharacterized protein YndB with AHSA1/START domain
MSADHAIELRSRLAAGPGRVFSALTGARELERWFCDEAESVPRVDGPVLFRWNRAGASSEPFVGRWVEFEPGSSCAYEGGHAGYPDGSAGRVGFRLAAERGGTSLRVRHAMPGDPRWDVWRARYREAWPRCLERLAAWCAAETTADAAGAPTAERT